MNVTWKLFLSEEKNRRRLFIVLAGCSFVLFLFFHFLSYNELRAGSGLNDPLLIFLTPFDNSFLIFVLTYLLSVSGLFIAFRYPPIFITVIGGYAILTLLRIFCLFLFPLEPPQGIIPLNDIFLHSSFYNGRQNLKDLFFSGHTATLFLFAFVFKNRILKYFFASGALVTGFLLVQQHVHYSIDILVAPIAAWVAAKIHDKLFMGT
jgi:hypothetical protein